MIVGTLHDLVRIIERPEKMTNLTEMTKWTEVPGEEITEIIEDLMEPTLRFESVGTHDVMMEVGDGATFYNEIYDADGNVVGDTVGIVIAISRNPSDGHIITDYTEAINLLGGTLRTNGTADRNGFLSGEVICFDMVGTSGRFLGMKGIRECRILPPYPATADSKVAVKFTFIK